MSYSFRPARRSEAKPLIGLYGESGTGKTYSALLLARGFVGPAGKIGMIETESGRGEAYADLIPGGYEVLSIRGDFSPKNFGDALTSAEEAKCDALIIDSASHEWSAAGGVLSMAADNQAKGIKGVLVWQQPKMQHQRNFMLRLLATPIALVIVCMRAKYPMIEITKDGRKEWVRSPDLEPDQAADILFEMFLHGWISRDHKFHGTKYSRDDLRAVIKDNEPISLETGQLLAKWAGGAPVSQTPSSPERKPAPPRSGNPADNEMGEEASETDSERLTRLTKAMREAKNTKDLAAIWNFMGHEDQVALLDTKDELKEALKKAAAQ